MPPPPSLNTANAIVGLPQVVFLFTVDQIAAMLNVEVNTVMTRYLYLVGRHTALKTRNQMTAINIAPDPTKDRPDWRVSHREFCAWAKRAGFRLGDLDKLR
jgi:hypothetical protein